MKTIAALCLALATMAAHAEEFSYKGVKLGESMEAFKEALPLYKCSQDSCTYLRQECAPVSGTGSSQDFSRRLEECREGTSYGGALVSYGRASFIDGKLASIYLVSPWMERVGRSLPEKYGAPTSTDDSPVKNKMGAEFPNWVKTWNNGGSRLIASLRGSKLDEGFILIESAAAIASQKQQEKDQAKTGAKDF